MAAGNPFPGMTLAICCALGACTTTHTVSFRRDIHPVLEAYCLECHSPPSGKGYLASGLDLHSHASLMRGSIYGAVVTPGNSRTSILAMLVEGRADPSSGCRITPPNPCRRETSKTCDAG
jgi:hypothetical protein